jgi:ATP-binding cassette, subfamily B, bacterial
LARLLTRLANPTEGELFINDINVKAYDPSILRRHITVLFQTPGEFEGLTIAENIGIGNINKIDSPPSIEKAALESGAAEFISHLPYKYDTYLSCIPGWKTYKEGFSKWEDNDNSDYENDSDNEDELKKEQEKRVQKDLSGGQWQKLGLARAFMRNQEADLMVLDEPTANLDPEAEFKLFETIKRCRRGRTTVFISHRFNTVRIADRIMVLDRGVVKEFGSHEELMRVEGGQYRRFYEVQAKGFVVDEKKVEKDGKEEVALDEKSQSQMAVEREDEVTLPPE